MTAHDFQMQRDTLYRELLKQLTTITNHPVVQCQIGLRDACVEIAKTYRLYNSLVDEMVR